MDPDSIFGLPLCSEVLQSRNETLIDDVAMLIIRAAHMISTLHKPDRQTTHHVNIIASTFAKSPLGLDRSRGRETGLDQRKRKQLRNQQMHAIEENIRLCCEVDGTLRVRACKESNRWFLLCGVLPRLPLAIRVLSKQAELPAIISPEK